MHEPGRRRRALNRRWRQNEIELRSLAELPASDTDPAERERQLDHEQDEIEFRAGLEYPAGRITAIEREIIQGLVRLNCEECSFTAEQYGAALLRLKRRLGEGYSASDPRLIRWLLEELDGPDPKPPA